MRFNYKRCIFSIVIYLYKHSFFMHKIKSFEPIFMIKLKINTNHR